jgi:hypothetical protein
VPAGSRLESLPTFDPLEDLDVDGISAAFGRLKEAIVSGNDASEFVCQLTGDCCALGRDGLVWLFAREDLELVRQFLRCVREIGKLRALWGDIVAGVTFCVKGNGLVLNYEMRRFFDVIWFILTVSLDDDEIVAGYLLLLHELRPLVVPVFGFAWVGLVADGRFLHQLIVRIPDGSDFLITLICDFEAAVGFAKDSKRVEVFEKLYHGLMRLILILAHDFPAFLFRAASEIVVFLPPGLLQLRNIILAVAPGPVPPPPNEARRHLPEVPGIEDFTEIEQPLEYLVEQLGFAEAIKNMSAFGELANQFKSQKSGSAIGVFGIFLGNMIGSGLRPRIRQRASSIGCRLFDS